MRKTKKTAVEILKFAKTDVIFVLGSAKRKRGSEGIAASENTMDTGASSSSASSATSTTTPNPLGLDNASAKKRKVESRAHTGAEYKAKKAKGDLKVSGKMDPFAFVAMDGKLLNRRYRKKEVKQFDHLLKKKGNKRK